MTRCKNSVTLIENMKARTFQNFGLALLLALAPLFWGCDQERANSATINDTTAPTTNAALDAADGQPPADANEPVVSDADSALENADGKLMSTPDTASTNTSNNPQLTDFVKLVQAGVGESVLMTYVTNSATPFNVSTDDIVYLNDLGAPEPVITAMLQRDQYFNGTATAMPGQTTPPVEATPPTMPEQAPVPDQNAMAAMAQTPPLTPPADIEQDVQQAPNGSYSYFYDSLAPMRKLGQHLRLRPVLAAHSRGSESRLATLLRSRSLGLHRLRLVLGVGLFVGLGAISLWPLVSQQSLGLVLGARHRLGPVLGELEI